MFRVEREPAVGCHGEVPSGSQGGSEELIEKREEDSIQEKMERSCEVVLAKANGPLYKRGSLDVKFSKRGHCQISGDKEVGWEYQCQVSGEKK